VGVWGKGARLLRDVAYCWRHPAGWVCMVAGHRVWVGDDGACDCTCTASLYGRLCSHVCAALLYLRINGFAEPSYVVKRGRVYRTPWSTGHAAGGAGGAEEGYAGAPTRLQR